MKGSKYNVAKKVLKRIIQYMFIAITAIFIIYPLLFTLLTSLKTKEGYISNPYGLDITNLTLDNYIKILENFDFMSKLMNTFVVVGISIVLILILAIPSAYCINALKRKSLQAVIIVSCFALMFIPEEVLILPEYNLMSKLGMINNYLSVIIIFVASSLPEAIFLLTIYFKAVPEEVIDAAKIDGADDLSCLLNVVIPISNAPIIVVGITTVISLWNTFLIPMMMLYEDDKKLLVPSLSGLITKHSTTPTYQMAGMFLAIIPLVVTYIIFKKHIFENSIGGAIK